METESDDSDNDDEEQESMVKRIQTLPKKAPKSPRPADTGPEDLEDDNEKKEPVVKKASKSPKLVKAGPKDSGDSYTEDTLRAMGFSIDKSLEVGKNEEGNEKGIYRGKKISYVAKFDTNYLKKMLTSSGVDKQTKEAIKQCLKQSR